MPASVHLTLRQLALAVVVLFGSLFAVYFGSLRAPFVFDDIPAIAENATLRTLWPLATPLSPPPGGLTVSGRPLLNLSLAINYAVGGLDVRGYRATNIALHALTALVLFGVLRRTLLRAPLAPRFGAASFPLALATALLWALHPLQTESVTYIVQRAECLGGLFHLLTLYAFIRSLDAPYPVRWQCASVAACLCGVASKETAMTAPLLVLAFDAIFVSDSWRSPLRQRGRYYLALATSWILLAALLVQSGVRGSTVGFSSNISALDYAVTQCWAIVRYLGLSLWPHPLVLDYGITVIGSLRAVWPQALLLTAAIAATLATLYRRRPLGFAAAGFFFILAPTSSFVPVATQTIAEHRMYLPLAVVVAGAVLGAFALAAQHARLLCALAAIAATALGFATVQRNADYRSSLSIFADTVAKRPDNWRARNDLGNALVEAGRPAEALPHYEAALRLEPRYARAHYNLGYALAALGRLDEAIAQFGHALGAKPDYALAHRGLAEALLEQARLEPALPHLQAAFVADPELPHRLNNRANALLAAEKTSAALATYAGALALAPEHVDARNNFANALLESGRPAEAIEHYRASLRLRPRDVPALFGLGNALATLDRLSEAATAYSTAVQLDPAHVPARANLGNALLALGRVREAIAAYEEALRLKPTDESLRANLAQARATLPP